jgi:putative sterol carrier protein
MPQKPDLGLARFQDLTNGGRADVAGTLEQFAAGLKASNLRGTVQFVIQDKDGEKTYAIHLAKNAPRVEAKASSKEPDLELLTTADTWMSIARGEISPLEAFGRGRMRVRGTNISIGPLILAHLSGGQGRVDIC